MSFQFYIRERIWPFLLTLKVEPFIFLFSSSLQISDISSTQLIQDKLCILRYNRSAEYCAQLSSEKSDISGDTYKTQILADLAEYSIYRTVISSLPSILFALFMGSWIDNYINGRKILLCFGSLGHAAQYGLLLVNALVFKLDVYYILLAYIPSALSGSWVCVWLAVYSYISNNSPKKYRIIKFALFEITVFSATPFGTYLGGRLLGKGYLHSNGLLFNYITVFATSAGGLITAFIWILFVINEKKVDINENTCLVNDSEEEIKCHIEKSVEITHALKSEDKRQVYKMFDFDNVREVFKTCLKLRPNKGRGVIWLLYLSMALLMMGNAKDLVILFPYVEDMFEWDAEMFSIVKSLSSIASAIATAVIVPALAGFFKVKDIKLGIIGFVSLFLAGLMAGTILTPTGLYISYAFGSFSGSASLAIRSLLSKIVTEAEVGKVFSLLAALETIVPSIVTVFYSTLFKYTINFYPSLSFQIAAGFMIIPLIIMIWIDMTRIQF